MNKGLRNFQIDEFFKNEENEDLKKNYMGTYSIDSITRYINFYEMIKKINGKYPFSIFSTDKENEPGLHWGSFIDIHPKNNLFLFDSFDVEDFKHLIVNTDQKVIKELLCNFKKCENNSSQKLKLCTMKFCVETWQKMSQKTKDQLTDTAQNFSHLLEQLAKLKKTHCMNVLILENSVQDLISPNWGEFQLYFYKNLFDSDEKSKILNHQTLNKSTLETIINEIFSTDVAENKHIFNNFKEEWIVNYFCFIIGKNSKTNNQVFIPSNGIGELCLDVFDMHWYHYESFFFNIDKEIPFMKLLLDMASLRMRYYHCLNGNPLLSSQTIINIGHTSAILVKTFIKI